MHLVDADFLGRDALMTVSRTSKDYNCFSCGQPGKATRERTNVVVVTGDGPPVINFAHGRCMQSQVSRATSTVGFGSPPQGALAGSLARKNIIPPGLGTLPTHTPLFVGLLVGVVIMVGALTFVPVLALGPVVEHLLMAAR